MENIIHWTLSPSLGDIVLSSTQVPNLGVKTGEANLATAP